MSIHLPDPSNGWAVGGSGTILHTADGGNTWDPQSAGTWEYLHSVHFTDTSNGWIVGGNGTIIHTDDGGNNWNPQVSGTSETLYSVHFANDSTGWVVGRSGTILHTADGGNTWDPQTSGTSETLHSVHFTDTSNGWTVGFYGTVLHTDDGGSTWNPQSSGTGQILQSVHFLDALNGWVVGNNGTVLHTDDGGSTWNTQTSGTGSTLFSVHSPVPCSRWTVGNSGTILHNSDATSSSITASACYSYTVPSGDETYMSSGIYQDTLSGVSGCDSLITIDLSIDTSSSSISPSTCYSYTVPSGDETYTSSGTYEDTLTNAAGCDSIISIDLTIDTNTFSSISPNVCDSYTVPSGDETYTSDGTYMDTIPNAAGCDSLISINLTIDSSTSSSIAPVACDSYTSPSGAHTWTSSGVYEDTLSNSLGCDSIITIGLSIENSSNSSISPSACGSYTSPSGSYTWTSSGTYMDTIPNAAGCDSLISVDLTVHNSTSASIVRTACNSYTSPSGDYIWTSSGVYEDTLSNAAGCDSLITIDLTIDTIDTTVSNPSAATLEAAASGVSYQWLDCNSGFAPISGETGQSFTASTNGSYAVEVSQDACTDTSSCHPLTVVGIVENELKDGLEFYPNPTRNEVSIEVPERKGALEVIVRDMEGRTISRERVEERGPLRVELGEHSGTYLIELRGQGGRSASIKVVKE